MVKTIRSNRSETVKKLLSGQSILGDNEIPEGSVEFWMEIYKEPKGNKQDPENHLANLEYTPNEKYEGMSKPIDETDVNEQIRRFENEISPGPDGLKKEGFKMDVGRWFNRILETGKLSKPLKTFLVILLPKLQQAKLPKGFRPIAIGSKGFKAGIEGCIRVLLNPIRRDQESH